MRALRRFRLDRLLGRKPTAPGAGSAMRPEAGAGQAAAQGGARVLIVSNCQAFMLYAMMQLLTRRHVVAYVTFPELQSKYPDAPAKERFLSGFEVVFLQTGTDSFAPPQGVATRIVTFPPVYFFGFHPDLVYASAEGRFLLGPLHEYQSSIVLWGYLHGLAPERVIALFRRQTYEALGFFGMFEESIEHYLGLLRAEGFEMRPQLSGWLRRGAFMYSVNHPKSYVLEDVARELWTRFDPGMADEVAGLGVSELVPDSLANGAVYPVYPELGLRLGIRGDYLFKPPESQRRLSLQEFVAASYAAYRGIDPRQIRCERFADPRYARLAELA